MRPYSQPNWNLLRESSIDHEQLVIRRKDFIDNAIPSGNSMAAEALVRLGVLVGNQEYRQEAMRIVLTMKEAIPRQPTGFGRLLGVLDALLSGSQEVAIVGEPKDAETQALLATVRRLYLPHTVLAFTRPDQENVLPLLQERTLVNGQAAAYVCENYACQRPVTTVAELQKLLAPH